MSGGRRAGVFRRVRERRLADPATGLVRIAPRLQPVLVARTVAAHDVLEFAPVDLAVDVLAAFGVPAQRRVRISSPRKRACGTVKSTNFCRSSSFVNRLIFQRTDNAVCGDAVSGGPNIISDGHHQRFSASCAIARCAADPRASLSIRSYPWRWWKLSSLQTRIIAREYGPYEQRHSGIWFMIAAPSTSQPIAPTSAQVKVG